MDERSRTGNWAELIAAAWLTQQGYEVFWGHGNTECDLVALKERACTRVEVKKASAQSNGRWCIARADPDKYDLLLVVLPCGDVLLNPSPSIVAGSR